MQSKYREDNPVKDAEGPGIISRRQALISGLAATPAIVTLLSRPVWAAAATGSVCSSLQLGTSLHTNINFPTDCEEQTTTSEGEASTSGTTELK